MLNLRRSYLHLKVVFLQFTSYHLHISFLSWVKMDSRNWPDSSVWFFLPQMVEHCSANAEAMGLNPIEVLKCFFVFICNCLNCNYHCDGHILFTASIL